MRGRKPQPTALKLAKGNPGKRPINESEPDLPLADASVEPPQPLEGVALEEWGRLAPDLVESGVLTVADLVPFWLYCYHWGEGCELAGRIAKMGYADAQKLGYPNRRDKAFAMAAKMASELGITPSARSRVRTTKPRNRGNERKQRFFGDAKTG